MTARRRRHRVDARGATSVGRFGRATQRLCAKSDGSQVQGHRRLQPLSLPPRRSAIPVAAAVAFTAPATHSPITVVIYTHWRLNASNVSSRSRHIRL